MTKKKLRRLIFIGVIMFYMAATLMNYFGARETVGRMFRSWTGDLTGEYYESLLITFKEQNAELIEEDSDKAAELFLYEYSRGLRNSIYPYSLAICDEEGNLTFASDNFIYLSDNRGLEDIFVDAEPYLTDELRKQIRNIPTQVAREINVNLYYTGEKYIPVSVKLKYMGEDGEETVELIFSDYEPNVTCSREDYWIDLCFNEVNKTAYHKKYFDYQKENIEIWYNRRIAKREKDIFDDEYRANFVKEHAGWSDEEFEQMEWTSNSDWLSGGEAFISSDHNVGCTTLLLGDGYEIYYSFGYNQPVTALLSDYFAGYTIYLSIIFAVAAIAFYIICMRVIKKSEWLEQAKTTFISAASHELKTPVAIIQNQCECIMENIAPDKNGEYVKSIYDEAVRMNVIVSSLLSYNKLSQLSDIKKESCNLSELLRQEVLVYRKFAENEGVEIEEIIESDIYTDCNIQLMKMAIDNYLSNAIKHSSGDKKMTVSLKSVKPHFLLEVMNSAEEASVDTAKKSWNEFSRGDASRQRQGTSVGMGLPICKKVFSLHGFTCGCEYKGGNAIFFVKGV